MPMAIRKWLKCVNNMSDKQVLLMSLYVGMILSLIVKKLYKAIKKEESPVVLHRGVFYFTFIWLLSTLP